MVPAMQFYVEVHAHGSWMIVHDGVSGGLGSRTTTDFRRAVWVFFRASHALGFRKRLYWTRQSFRDPGLIVPLKGDHPAFPVEEAVELGRKLAKEKGWV